MTFCVKFRLKVKIVLPHMKQKVPVFRSFPSYFDREKGPFCLLSSPHATPLNFFRKKGFVRKHRRVCLQQRHRGPSTWGGGRTTTREVFFHLTLFPCRREKAEHEGNLCPLFFTQRRDKKRENFEFPYSTLEAPPFPFFLKAAAAALLLFWWRR